MDIWTDDFTWNDIARDAVTTGLNAVPVVGGLLSGLLGILWPESKGPTVWEQIADQVKDVVGIAIDTAVLNTALKDLDGLRAVSDDFASHAQTEGASGDATKDKFYAAQAEFLERIPSLQIEAEAQKLLPIFARAVNLHLALMRDGLIFGADWGMGDGDLTALRDTFQAHVTAYKEYAEKHVAMPEPGPVVLTGYKTSDWGRSNRYSRYMTFTVSDHAHYWPYFDPEKTPGGDPKKMAPPPRRVIYCDPIANIENDGPLITNPPEKNWVKDISVGGGRVVQDITLTMANSDQPGGVRFVGTGKEHPETHGGFNLSVAEDGQIASLSGISNTHGVYSMIATRKDGAEYSFIPKDLGPGGIHFVAAMKDHVVCDIGYVAGGEGGGPLTLVVGFQFDGSWKGA